MMVSIAALGALACGPSQRREAPAPSDDAAGLSLWQIEGRWENASGGELELGSLRGAPTLLLFFYGSCESACPALVRNLQSVEARLPAATRSRLQFVLVTIDPVRDTLENLAEYARKRRLDPSRWFLLRGAPDQVRELASAAGVRYRDARTGQLSHTMRIFLLDRTGVELEHWDGLDPPVDAIVRSVTDAAERG
jgi:protein SCO1/2